MSQINELTSVNFLNKKRTPKLMTLFIFGLGACSSGIQVQEIPETANAVEELNSLDADSRAALANQVNILSPHNYQETMESIADAKTSLSKQKKPSETLHLVSRGRAYLRRANEAASLARSTMEEVVVARRDAIQAGAPEFFTSDFRKLDEDLKDVTEDLEENELKSAQKNRTELQAGFLDLELRAIKQTQLSQSKKAISKAIDAGAKEFAPQSLAIAEKNFADTEAYITANRHQNDQIVARTLIMDDSSAHLLKITSEAKGTKKVSPEHMALELERKQQQVAAQKLDLTVEKGITKTLINENRELSADAAFNAKFEQARREFSKGEAEVYQQGNALVIRLRGLEFPTSQAVLTGNNFALLAKVQRVIKDFGSSSVIVEGHTDSRGTKEANAKLSTERAQAVTEYLISNEAIAREKIKAIGYDFQKPLGTNKTVAGRTQNRRVDVVIAPDTDRSL
jgi:OOP family OmpA-OmpF porin